MRRSQFSEEQIIAILKEAGKAIGELCREHSITDQTCYRWKAKYGGLELSEVRRLRQLEDESRRIKHLVTDLTLDNQTLKGWTELSIR